MKKLIRPLASILMLCCVASFISFKPLYRLAATHRVAANNKHLALLQTRQPFCQFHIMNHEGRLVVMRTDIMHSTSNRLTFLFNSGERLIIIFRNAVKIGNYDIESTRSDPQVLFYPLHSAQAVSLIGTVKIFNTKPIVGAFPHLSNVQGENISIMSGGFSF